jgi:hypothetical protein
MNDEERYTLEEAHLQFAKKANGVVWGLLEKSDRSKEESAEMLHAAHASLFHWLHAGTGLHQQRGEWLISRVHSVLGNGIEALRHAERCAELTAEHTKLMQDFDKAYSLECLARSHALVGDEAKAAEQIDLAKKAGEAIADKESRDIFFQDFDGGDWYGVKSR